MLYNAVQQMIIPDRDTFNPDEPVTQAEAIAMIYQGLVQLGEVEPIESEYIVNP